MTTPAFSHLLHEARKAHQSHPELAAFVGFPDDLTDQEMAPFTVPAAGHLARETGLFGTAQAAFRDAFTAAGGDAHWR